VLASGKSVLVSLDNDRRLEVEVVTTRTTGTPTLPKFTLNGNANNLIGADGTVIEQKFPMNAKTFCEVTLRLVKAVTMARSDTFANQIVVRINVDSNLNPQVVHNYRLGIRLRKVCEYTGDPLANARLRVRDRNNNIVHDGITGDDGYTEYFVTEPGPHVVTEIEAPDGYQRTDEEFEFYVHEDGRVEGTIVILNKQEEPGERLRKVDAITGEPLAGAYLEIRCERDTVIFTGETGRDGYTARFPVTPGKYFVRELRAPPGYIRDPNQVWEFEFHADGTFTGTIIIPNMPETPPRDYIWKFNAQFTDVPVEGALIHIFDRNSNCTGRDCNNRGCDECKIRETVSDRYGRAWFYLPPPGRYSFREVRAPEGYHLNRQTYFFTVTQQWTVTTDCTNHPNPGKLEIGNIPDLIELLKIDGHFSNEERGIPGAHIEIMNDRDERIDILISDENGRMQIRLTEPGIYKFREIRAPQGFVLNETVYIFELRDDGRIDGRLTLVNHRERNVPQTGVDTNRLILTILLITLGATAVIVPAIIYRKEIVAKFRK